MDKNIREIIKAELNRLLNEELSVSSIVTVSNWALLTEYQPIKYYK